MAQAGVNLIAALSVVAGAFLVLVAVNAFFWFDTATRASLFFAWIALSAFVVLWALVPPLAKPPSLRRIAMEFERYYPQLREHLIAAYDLAREDPSEYGFSPSLVDAVVRRAVELARPLGVRRLLPLRAATKRAAVFAILLLLLFGSAAAFPLWFAAGARKALLPFTPFRKPTKTTLFVTLPAGGRAVRFDNYTIKVRAAGSIPDKVWVYRRLGDEGFVPFEAQRDPTDPKLFRYTFRKVADRIEFFVTGGDYKSRVFKVEVLDLPRVVDVALEYRFPRYTGLARQRVERNDGNIDALYGTQVTVEALVSKKIARAQLLLNDGTTIPMRCLGRKAFGKITVLSDGTYTIKVWDDQGNTDPQPPLYSIRVHSDEAPVVQITLPGKDTDINEEMKLPIQVYAEDDFGFSKFLLKFVVVTQESTVHSYKLPFSLFGKRQVVLDFVWDLSPLGLVPDDVVKYWVEGYDNDALRGPKMGKSKVYAVRFPSIDEIIEEVTGEQREQMRSVDEAIQHQKEIAERMEEMARRLEQETEKLSYEQRKEAERLLEQQRQLAQRLAETARKMRETIERIEQNKLVAQKILEKMWELQRLLDEILPEELKEALRQMQEALEKMNPELLRRAMRNLNISQRELLQRLDRALELLKRIQVEMQLDELRKLAQRIKELQDRINEGLKSGRGAKELSRMESEVRKQLQSLQNQAAQLAKQMKEFPEMPAEDMQKLAQQLAEQSLPEQAELARSHISRGKFEAALKTGQNISSAMGKLGESLASLQEKMQQALQAQLTADITRTVRELLYISSRQEELVRDVERERDRQKLILLAGVQDELRQALRRSIERVGEIGGKTFLLPPAVGALLAEAEKYMSEATSRLSQGRSFGAPKSGREAMGNVNAAAEMLLRTMNSMCQSSSPSGMEQLMQQLKSLCEKQGCINQQTLPLFGACQNPGGLTPEQMATAARLAAEQEAIRKTLEQLREEFEQHANLLGRMEQTIEDMKRVEEDLRRFNVNERTLRRQDRILSRMLDAQKSLHKREYTEKRRSRPGKDVVRKSPGPLPEDLGERKNLIRQSLLQILANPYPRQYQEQVRQYFRALEREGK